MPKEDAQLIAPVSYDDPSSLWGVLGDHLRMQLPLRDLVVKSPLTGHSVTIASLPLRFMPASAPLFKDTNHPFRWFLAPYVHIYLLQAANMVDYRAARSALKQWVEQRNIAKQPWVVVHVCTAPAPAPDSDNSGSSPGGGSASTITTTSGEAEAEAAKEQGRVYDRLSTDFYASQAGDRSVHVQVQQPPPPPPLQQQQQQQPQGETAHDATGARASSSAADSGTSKSAGPAPAPAPTQFIALAHLIRRLSEGVVSSFHARAALYIEEISLLDAAEASGTDSARVDFRQLFLVKESLALMYQMMQLPYEALVRYDELQGLLPLAQQHDPAMGGSVLGWPLTPSPLPAKEKEKDTAEGGPREVQGGAQAGADIGTGAGVDVGDSNSDAARDANAIDSTSSIVQGIFRGPLSVGDDIMSYSINLSRKRILKSRIGAVELNRYIFARQAHFLGLMKQWGGCADRGLQYVTSTRRTLLRRVEKEVSAVRARLQHLSTLKAAPPAGTLTEEDRREEVGKRQLLAMLPCVAHAVDAWAIAAVCRVYQHCRAGAARSGGCTSPSEQQWPLGVGAATTATATAAGAGAGAGAVEEKVDRRVCDQLVSLLQFAGERIAAHWDLLRYSRKRVSSAVSAVAGGVPLLHRAVGTKVSKQAIPIPDLLSSGAGASVDVDGRGAFASALNVLFCELYPDPISSPDPSTSGDGSGSVGGAHLNCVGTPPAHLVELVLTLQLHTWQLQERMQRPARAAVACVHLGDIFAGCANLTAGIACAPGTEVNNTTDLDANADADADAVAWGKAHPLYVRALARGSLSTPQVPLRSASGNVKAGSLERWPAVHTTILLRLLRSSAYTGNVREYVHCAVLLRMASSRQRPLLAERLTRSTDVERGSGSGGSGDVAEVDLLLEALSFVAPSASSSSGGSSSISASAWEPLEFPLSPLFAVQLGLRGGATVSLAHRRESVDVPLYELCCVGISTPGAGTEEDEEEPEDDPCLPTRTLQVTVTSHLASAVPAQVLITFRSLEATESQSGGSNSSSSPSNANRQVMLDRVSSSDRVDAAGSPAAPSAATASAVDSGHVNTNGSGARQPSDEICATTVTTLRPGDNVVSVRLKCPVVSHAVSYGPVSIAVNVLQKDSAEVEVGAKTNSTVLLHFSSHALIEDDAPPLLAWRCGVLTVRPPPSPVSLCILPPAEEEGGGGGGGGAREEVNEAVGENESEKKDERGERGAESTIYVSEGGVCNLRVRINLPRYLSKSANAVAAIASEGADNRSAAQTTQTNTLPRLKFFNIRLKLGVSGGGASKQKGALSPHSTASTAAAAVSFAEATSLPTVAPTQEQQQLDLDSSEQTPVRPPAIYTDISDSGATATASVPAEVRFLVSDSISVEGVEGVEGGKEGEGGSPALVDQKVGRGYSCRITGIHTDSLVIEVPLHVVDAALANGTSGQWEKQKLSARISGNFALESCPLEYSTSSGSAPSSSKGSMAFSASTSTTLRSGPALACTSVRAVRCGSSEVWLLQSVLTNCSAVPVYLCDNLVWHMLKPTQQYHFAVSIPQPSSTPASQPVSHMVPYRLHKCAQQQLALTPPTPPMASSSNAAGAASLGLDMPSLAVYAQLVGPAGDTVCAGQVVTVKYTLQVPAGMAKCLGPEGLAVTLRPQPHAAWAVVGTGYSTVHFSPLTGASACESITLKLPFVALAVGNVGLPVLEAVYDLHTGESEGTARRSIKEVMVNRDARWLEERQEGGTASTASAASSSSEALQRVPPYTFVGSRGSQFSTVSVE